MVLVARLRSFVFVAVSTGLASSVSLLGGVGLEHVAERLLPLIPLLVAIPALNDLVGDYASIIAAHTGDPDERRRSPQVLAKAISRIVGFNVIAIITLSLLVAAHRHYVLTSGFILKFAAFISLAVIIVIILMFWLNRLLDRLLLRQKINPDDLLIPISTSIADIVMLGLVALATILIF